MNPPVTSRTPPSDLPAISHDATDDLPARPHDLPTGVHGEPSSSPDDTKKLAAIIAAAKALKRNKAHDLERFRPLLLAERKAGTSVPLLAASLRRAGMTISPETLRLWLLKQEARKTTSRKEPKAHLIRRGVVGTMSAIATKPVTAKASKPGPRIAREDI